MPWWVYLYLVLYCSFTAWSSVEDVCERRSFWTISIELIADGVLMGLALAYWQADWRMWLESTGLTPLFMPLFSAALASLAVSGLHDVRRYILADEEMSTQTRWIVLSIGSVFLVLLYGPLLYWGFLFAVLGNVALL